ncbi:MAG TPA: potassium transporter TrkG [Candidatus Limnocylindrales bacterium]|nr:potassium transporter TrkG [Candidatus Limnocylindrales bacterium]
MLVLEWSNPKTFGPLDVPDKLLAAFFQGTSPRTAGLNTVDFAQMHSETLLITDWLMFIGGGSAGTSALALSERRALYRYAEERPIVG